MSNPARRPARRRSFGGCRTCRRRHVKCDQQRPGCRVCERLRLDCEGYESLIQWTQPLGISSSFLADDAAPREPEDSRQCRRLLFSDAERRAMCVELAKGLDGNDYKAVVSLMEERCLAGDEAVNKGPFTVFQLNTSQQPEALPDLEDDPLSDIPPFDVTTDPELLQEQFNITSPTSSPDLSDESDAPLISNAMPELQKDDFSLISFLFSPTDQTSLSEHMQQGTSVDAATHNQDDDGTGFMNFVLTPMPHSPQDFSITDAPGSPISPEGHLLLSHFIDDFVKVASPIPNAKSPWQILYFPEALSTVGQLTLRTQPSSASLSLLCSLMVISAFHLDRLSGAEAGCGYWWKVAESYQAKAMSHIHASLRNEVEGPRKAKYKTLLMALLTMVTACITNGKLVDARKHLLDAQRLIHTRGLSKTKASRKVQMLHAMFLYLRIMEEASFVYRLSSDSDFFKHGFSTPSSARYPSLAGHKWFGTQADGVPTNYRELDDFLEASGPEIRPLFLRIYGIPESLMVLLSHITYLCCEVRQTKAHPHPSPDYSDDFNKRCKVVEGLLCDWKAEEAESMPTGSTSTIDSATNAGHAAQAFHASLVVFFYREVKDIHRFLLQHHVKKIREHLLALEGEKVAQNIASASTIWPGFIAAVEALDYSDFADVTAWMRSCADRYGLRSFDRAADVAADIWGARQCANQDVVKWPERMLLKKSFLILP